MKVLDRTYPLWSFRSPLALFGQLILVLLAAYLAADAIVSNNSVNLLLLVALPLVLVLADSILNNWRRGLYFFVFWLLFEDFIRKYLGNNMAIYFVKDALVIILYLSFFRNQLAKKLDKFHLPFRVPLLLFLWLCLLQVFNPGSPSFLFGLLGLKINFLYVPLIYIGYTFAKSEEEVRRLLSFLSVLILIVAGLGLAQAIIGPSFLNPQNLQEDIRQLSTLYRTTASGAMAYRPTSVFVSSGRLQDFLELSWILCLGHCAYLVLRGIRKRALAFAALAVVGAASVMSASRGVFMWNSGSALVMTAGLLWGSPWRQRETIKVLRTIQRAALLTGIGLFLLLTIFPEELGSRLAIYSETLLPDSPTSELVHRTQTYPLQQLQFAFEHPRWPIGYGTGVCGLGLQYIVRLTGTRPPQVGVESGMGNLVVELGVLGLVLWIIMGLAIVLSAWKIVNGLRGSPWFPLAFSIFLYATLLLFPMMFFGTSAYQDFILNAFLWLLLGVLYRLKSWPKALQAATAQTAPAPSPLWSIPSPASPAISAGAEFPASSRQP